MKRVWITAGVLALVFESIAGAITLAEINGSGGNCGIGCIQIGDKRFTNILLDGHNTSTEGAWTAANVDVIGSVGGDGTVFIGFNLPAAAGFPVTASSFVDFVLFYTVTTTGGQFITEIDQLILGGGGLDNGFVNVTEHVFSGGVELANSNVTIPGDPLDPNAEANDRLILSTPVNTANVRKDVFLFAGSHTTDVSGLTTLTLIQQSFHQVPEPAHYVFLLGAGMIGLWYKSRKRAQV